MFSEWLRALRSAVQAWPWIAFTALILVCAWIVHEQAQFPLWLSTAAKALGVGASTALFTRFLGGMGMFRDAISDVLGEDRWLDRRNDLEDLWRRITRRIFLPGFREDALEAPHLLAALNSTMTKMIHKPEQRVNYFAKEMIRRITISWQDEIKRIVAIDDLMETVIVPFDPLRGCSYEMIFTPTTGERITDYTITLAELHIGDIPQDVSALKPVVDNNKNRFVVPLKGEKIRLKRRIVSTQSVDNDPIFVVAAGRVVWGMSAIITVDAPGLRINFEEVGVDGMFRPVRQDPVRNVSEWSNDGGALLPEQGFMVVMAASGPSRSSVSVVAAASDQLVYTRGETDIG